MISKKKGITTFFLFLTNSNCITYYTLLTFCCSSIFLMQHVTRYPKNKTFKKTKKIYWVIVVTKPRHFYLSCIIAKHLSIPLLCIVALHHRTYPLTPMGYGSKHCPLRLSPTKEDACLAKLRFAKINIEDVSALLRSPCIFLPPRGSKASTIKDVHQICNALHKRRYA